MAGRRSTIGGPARPAAFKLLPVPARDKELSKIPFSNEYNKTNKNHVNSKGNNLLSLVKRSNESKHSRKKPKPKNVKTKKATAKTHREMVAMRAT